VTVESTDFTFKEYQKESRKTAIYPGVGCNLYYPALGLCGECGEVAEKVKKIMRDDNGKITSDKKDKLEKEIGDVIWYIAQLCSELKLDFGEVARKNLAKLFDRQARGKLGGSGDDR